MTRPTCATCKAFDGEPDEEYGFEDGRGFCRAGRPAGTWSIVRPYRDWCLEHIPAIDPAEWPMVTGERG